MNGTDNMMWISDLSNDLWKELNNSVHDEIEQINIAAKFIPAVPSADPSGSTVSAQVVDLTNFTINERATVDILETSLKFNLTKTQAGDEVRSQTARTLAANGAREIALARDRLFFG